MLAIHWRQGVTSTCSDNKEDSGGSSSPGQLILSRIQLCTPLVVALNTEIVIWRGNLILYHTICTTVWFQHSHALHEYLIGNCDVFFPSNSFIAPDSSDNLTTPQINTWRAHTGYYTYLAEHIRIGNEQLMVQAGRKWQKNSTLLSCTNYRASVLTILQWWPSSWSWWRAGWGDLCGGEGGRPSCRSPGSPGGPGAHAREPRRCGLHWTPATAGYTSPGTGLLPCA